LPELRVVPDDHVASIEHFLGVLGAPPAAVIHVGAHEGQEVPAYLAAGARSVVLVEANPQHVATLRERFAGTPQVRVVGCAVGAEPGTARLRLHTSRSGDTQSASLLELAELAEAGTVATRGTIEVEVRTLDDIAAGEACDLLVVDVQGAELLALQGAAALLQRVRAVICEIELRPLYAGAPAEKAIVDLLAAAGLERADALHYELTTAAGERRLAWADVLFVRP
jgi:FkbM family methyltransferase